MGGALGWSDAWHGIKRAGRFAWENRDAIINAVNAALINKTIVSASQIFNAGSFGGTLTLQFSDGTSVNW